MKRISLSVGLIVLVISSIQAQFPYSETFKGASTPGLEVSGAARLTASAGIDPITDGYLRLTDNVTNQVGYVYAQDSFPAAYGLTISFEFFTHKPGASTFNQADGISFFLFDASVNAFRPGGFGGSLGYAQYYSIPGMAKGYFAVSIDEFGNFSSASDGNKSGGPGQKRGSVVIRGPGNGLSNSDYPYQTGVQTDLAPYNISFAGFTQRFPDSTHTNYRRLKVILTPGSSLGASKGYRVTVIMFKGGAPVVPVTLINNFDYPFIAPPKLQYGLAASTGSNTDFHEIRNMNVVPTNVSDLLPATANNDLVNMVCQDGQALIDPTENDVSNNTGGSINRKSIDLNPVLPGVQTSFTDAGKGTYSVNAQGIVSFVPEAGFTGDAVANYTVADDYGMTSASASITVSVLPGASPGLTVADPSAVCAPGMVDITNATLRSNTTPGASFDYFSSLTDANSNINNINMNASAIAASGTYYIRTALGGCVTIKPVTVTINTPPTPANAGSDQSYCTATGSQSATLLGNNPDVGSGAWSQISGPSTATIAHSGSATTSVSNMQKGVYNFRWSVNSGACGSSADDVRITVGIPSNAGANQVLCNAGMATLNANSPLPGTGNWTQVSGPAITITSPADPASTITGLTAGNTYVLAWRITNGSCVSSTQVTITNQSALVSNAGATQNLTNATSTTLSANIPGTGSGLWTQISGPTATINTPTSAGSTISGLTPGNSYVFAWTVTNGVCPAVTSQVTINNALLFADAGPDQTINDFYVVTLAGNAPGAGNTGQWTIVSAPAGSTPVIEQPDNNASAVTLSRHAGDYYFRWTVSNGTVSAADDMRLSVLAVLPVTLISFNGWQENDAVRLQWETASEIDHAHFRVEKSFDGMSFSTIAKVAAAGSAIARHQYTYLDKLNGSPAPVVYYRLCQVDADGKQSYSKVLRLALNEEKEAMSVWPNPFNSQLNITAYFSSEGKATIRLVDMRGRAVRTWQQKVSRGRNQLSIHDMQGLTSGHYVLEIIKEKTTYRKGVLLERK